MDATEPVTDLDADADDPIATFLEEIDLYGRSEKTIADYETTLRQFERFLQGNGEPTVLSDVGRRDCLSWIQHLRDEGYAPGSIRTKAVHLNRFYGHMAQVGAFDVNPMVVVMEQLNERGDASPTRRDVSIEQMGAVVREIDHPLRRAVVTMLAKTGVRAGELCNLDFRDVNLDHSAVIEHREKPPRAAVRDHPDSFFVASDVAVGSVVNGERREEGNKRHRDTRIPIDEEVKDALVRWLAIRPDPASDAEPLFVSTSRKCGQRLTADMVHSHVREAANRRNWYSEGAGPEENVTPHYFRHFFTTRLRGRVDDAYLVQYIRGDVGDVMDRYTHDWEELVEKPYRDNIFRFGE